MDAGKDKDISGTLGKDRNVSYTDGDDPRRPAKFGRPRSGNDADAAYLAQLENNADPVYEEVNGRCSFDGLPVGNCAHFPGEQLVIPAPGEDPYAVKAETPAREDRKP